VIFEVIKKEGEDPEKPKKSRNVTHESGARGKTELADCGVFVLTISPSLHLITKTEAHATERSISETEERSDGSALRFRVIHYSARRTVN